MDWTIEDWNIEEMTGYKPQTTFYSDFSIAEKYGINSIKETYENAMENWKKDKVFLTELVMALNWKLWRWYQHNDKLARVYNELWEKASRYAETHLKGEDLQYYYRVTD